MVGGDRANERAGCRGSLGRTDQVMRPWCDSPIEPVDTDWHVNGITIGVLGWEIPEMDGRSTPAPRLPRLDSGRIVDRSQP